jgi:hypothetical protein
MTDNSVEESMVGLGALFYIGGITLSIIGLWVSAIVLFAFALAANFWIAVVFGIVTLACWIVLIFMFYVTTQISKMSKTKIETKER